MLDGKTKPKHRTPPSSNVSLLGIKTESLKKILIAPTLVYNFIV